MNVYLNNKNNKLYTLEHLVRDMRFLNGNAFSGIYAIPYFWKGETIKHLLGDYREGKIDEFNPEKFVKDNFEIAFKLK